jgi:hypothetical protein
MAIIYARTNIVASALHFREQNCIMNALPHRAAGMKIAKNPQESDPIKTATTWRGIWRAIHSQVENRVQPEG